MSLTRKMLKGMSLTEEQVDSIIENHTETVNGLKDEITKLTEEKESLENDKKELEKSNKALEKFKAEHGDEGENPFEAKYNELKEEYDSYKEGVEAEKKEQKDKATYKKILKEAGVLEATIDSVIKITDLEKLKYDKDGNLTNKEELINEAKETWKAFIPTTTVQGATVTTPPSNDGAGNAAGGRSHAAQRAMQMKENLYGKAESK